MTAAPSTATLAETLSTLDAAPPRAALRFVPRPSKRALWAGRILSGLAVAFLTVDAAVKLIQHPTAVNGTVELGYPAGVLLGLGIVQAICLVAYLIPRTSVLGAILWTGYLGGAIATHVRLSHPLFSHILFPTYLAALLWGGLWLRNNGLRALLPFTASANRENV